MYMLITRKPGNREIEGEEQIKHLLCTKSWANFIVIWFHLVLQTVFYTRSLDISTGLFFTNLGTVIGI